MVKINQYDLLEGYFAFIYIDGVRNMFYGASIQDALDSMERETGITEYKWA